MNNTLSVSALTGALVALVVAMGVNYFGPSKTQRIVQPTETIVREVIEVIKGFGAIPGTEISGDSFTINGVRRVANRIAFQTATRTLCVIPAPVGSSTLSFFSIKLNSAYGTVTSGGGAPVINVFRAAEALSTSTVYASTTGNVIGQPWRPRGTFGDALIVYPAATTTGTDIETLSPAQTASNTVSELWSNQGASKFPGGGRHDTIVARISNAAAGDYRGYSPTGFCQAEWLVVD